jgi:myosin heavy subunit
MSIDSNSSGLLIQDKFFRDYEFGIEHYAGPVIYDATNFVKKNMDTLPGDLKECAKKCRNKLVREEIMIADNIPAESSPSGAMGRGIKRQSSGMQLRNQLVPEREVINRDPSSWVKSIFSLLD